MNLIHDGEEARSDEALEARCEGRIGEGREGAKVSLSSTYKTETLLSSVH